MFRILAIIAICGAVAVAAVHFLLVGLRRLGLEVGPPEVRRLSLWERLVHALTMLSFLVLAVTGFLASLAGHRMTGYSLMLHCTAAPAFIIGLAFMTLTWAEDCRYARHDLDWLRACPCLKREEGAPAGRFDAAQKTFFWLVALLGIPVALSSVLSMFPLAGTTGQELLYETHRYSALLLVMVTIVHTYNQTLGRPGTWRALLSGKVGANWAKRYHPLWWEKVSK